MLTGCLENYFPEKKPPNDAIATSNLLSKFISHSVSALAKLKFGEQASHCHCVCTDQIWEKRDGLGVRNLPTHNGRSRRHNHDQQRPNGKKTLGGKKTSSFKVWVWGRSIFEKPKWTDAFLRASRSVWKTGNIDDIVMSQRFSYLPIGLQRQTRSQKWHLDDERLCPLFHSSRLGSTMTNAFDFNWQTGIFFLPF